MFSDTISSERDTIKTYLLYLEEEVYPTTTTSSVHQRIKKRETCISELCTKNIRTLQTIYVAYPNYYHKNICSLIVKDYFLRIYGGKDNSNFLKC